MHIPQKFLTSPLQKVTKMEQFRLMVFEAVWTTGSYTKAARQLGITQPAVSQNIAELERELGTALFERVPAVAASTADGSVSGDEDSAAVAPRGGKMLPTPAAEVFMQLVRRVLKGYDDIRTLFNPEAAEYGTVRIRADRSATEYALPKVMKVLRAAHPAVNFEVLPSETAEDTTPAEAPEPVATEGATEPAVPVPIPDVIITTIPIEQNGTITLRFEVVGSATPFVEAVRLILSASDMADMAGANH